MIIELADGKKEVVHAGSIMMGKRVISITLTADDAEEIVSNVGRDRFSDWLYNSVFTRFKPKSI